MTKPLLPAPHGSPADRGSADAYYRRQPEPHRIDGMGRRIPLTDPADIALYNAGYAEQCESGDFKEYD